ncbi:hypothetical protein ABW02_12785 [Niallia circulans]|uniref:Glycosyl transferase family 1 domain-containing protein n=1 Tax=Niallia circulans TaxID=1397 RepID=A0A0J1IJ45_NIACI|nr:glycosyltransferase family 4 protein [Niallia circulans]KLV25964.1 hypothetical protein ABW02_12785 [Niallia circulans]
MKKNLYILHENGAPRHFESIHYLNERKKYYDKIVELEFSIIRQLGKGILKGKPEFIFRAIRNLLLMVYFIFTKKKKIIIGAAPYDIFVLYLILLKKRHELVYYSSWPYWNKANFPKKVYFKFQFKLWDSFLTNIKVVGVTDKVGNSLRKYSNDITIIPHCINPSIFKPDNTRKKNDKIRIIFVGRLIPEKGIELILNLANKISGSMNNIEWWFVGDGSLKDKVIEASNTNPSVKYFGKVNNQIELAEIYKQCNIVILPSIPNGKWEELFGIVLIEAMACGLVPIASDNIGPKSIIRNNYDGFLVEGVSEGNFEKIIKSIMQNHTKLDEISVQSIAKVKSLYTVEITSEKWSKVLGINEY